MARIVGFLILAISAQAMAKFDVDPDQCQVIFDNFPYCMDFLIGSNDWPSRQCCQRVYDFNALAKHGMGPRAICECIEIITVTIPMKLRVDRISDLPVRCSTHLSFPISEYMDCNSCFTAKNNKNPKQFLNPYKMFLMTYNKTMGIIALLVLFKGHHPEKLLAKLEMKNVRSQRKGLDFMSALAMKYGADLDNVESVVLFLPITLNDPIRITFNSIVSSMKFEYQLMIINVHGEPLSGLVVIEMKAM
ncbi:hypothetical protein OIU76_025345 [Salix suchowensis]|nr:hypothetical protein OIU76_025345 [Salix suchowensis]